jgi:hypothetical protein
VFRGIINKIWLCLVYREKYGRLFRAVLAPKKGFARVLTMLILFLIAAVGVILIFSLFTGYLHVGAASSPDSVSISGTFATATVGGDTGTLELTVQNLGPSPANAITITCPLSSFSSSNCGGLTLLTNGAVVSSQNLLPKDQSASGSSTVYSAVETNFSAGSVITFQYSVSFSDGTSVTSSFQLATQT